MYLVLLILCSGVVLAERMLEVEDIRFYQNDDRVSGIDFDGELEEVYRGDKIKIRVELLNRDDERIDDILVFAEIKDIDDGDDIEEELDDFNLEDGDDVSKEIELRIPKDADFENYDMFVKIRGILENDTEELAIFNYTIDVMEKPIDLEELLTDINTSLRDIKESVGESYANASTITELNIKIGNLENEVRDKEDTITERDKTIKEKDSTIDGLQGDVKSRDAQIDEHKEDLDKLQPKASTLESIRVTYGCDDNVAECIKEQFEDKDQTKTILMWLIPGAAFAVWWFMNRARKPKIEIDGEKGPRESLMDTALGVLKGK